MVTRFDLIHDEVVSHAAGHWEHSAAHGLAHDKDVGSDIFVLNCEHLSSAAKSSLDLICDQKHIELGAQLANLSQVAFLWDDDTTLALDRLDAHSTDVGVSHQHLAQSLNVVIGEDGEAGCKRTEIGIPSWIVTCTRCCDRPAPEVSSREQDLSLVMRDALNTVTPATCHLASCFVSFTARVHWDELVVAEQLSEIVSAMAKSCVVEGT